MVYRAVDDDALCEEAHHLKSDPSEPDMLFLPRCVRTKPPAARLSNTAKQKTISALAAPPS
jgi:hypothetical protein